jgi:predicted ArsR family transcriptional regulator
MFFTIRIVYIRGVPDEVTYGALAVASRRRLLEVLRASEERLDVPALAAATGLHPNTVRFHLDVLVRAGFVAQHSDERGARGRPRTMYAPAVAAGHDDGYHLLAEMLVTHFDEAGDGAAAERAGHAWARRRTPAGPAQPGVAAATRTAVALFTEMGFDPAAVRHGRGRRILLRACPFRALAEKHPGVVCTLHLGLLRGIVERASTGTADAQLTPFVQPHLCVAEIVASERERTP